MRVKSAVVAAVLVAACAPTGRVNPELRRRAAATPLLTPEQVGTRGFSVVDEVAGRSCVRDAGASPSVEIARESLRLEAARMDADAVTSILCREHGLDVTHGCTKSIECRGDAIRWTTRGG